MNGRPRSCRDNVSSAAGMIRETNPQPEAFRAAAGTLPLVLGTGSHAADQIIQQLRPHRLDKVVVEACRLRAPPILVPAVAGHGNQQDLLQPRELAQPPRDLVAVHARQPDIQENDLGAEFHGQGQSLRTILSDTYVVPGAGQEQSRRLGGIRIVVDNKDAPCGPRVATWLRRRLR